MDMQDVLVSGDT